MQIVGVVSDARYQRLQEEPRAVAYLPQQQQVENMFLELRRIAGGCVGGSAAKRAASTASCRCMQTVGERIREALVTEGAGQHLRRSSCRSGG